MNFKRFGSLLPDNPLCNISTYKDTLNLATGVCTRQIKKLKLLSSLGWNRVSNGAFYTSGITDYLFGQNNIVRCSHFESQINTTGTSSVNDNKVAFYFNYSQQQVREFYVAYRAITSLDEFKAFLDNNDVYIWYVLATPTTETITVPSGLSGTEEGYLNQSGTPTPTNPIYPTVNEVKVWNDTPYYIRKTDTDTLTLPAVIYGDGTNATITLKGNEEHTGTPSPQNPVDVNGVGERTANLTSTNAWKNIYTTDTRSYFSASFQIVGGTQSSVNVRDTGNYTLKLTGLTNETVRFKHNGAATDIIIFSYACNFSEPTDLTISFYANGYNPTVLNGIDITNIMLNTGSTALPYEPYGYKIPISSANTTTPVYLGDVQTTRKIKKLVLTGEENITSGHLDIGLFNIPIDDYIREPILSLICTHYIAQSNVVEWSRVSNKNTCFYVGSTVEFRQLYIRDSSYSTIADFKSYLAQQYANGTPVCVWYVLATSTTGIVNEPLMKIGDYADTLSNAASIPTTDGANTITVDTTVQPSEFTATWTGWHDASVQEWDGSQWNE